LPAAVPEGTDTAPVPAFSAMAALLVETSDRVTRAVVATPPLNLSFARTLATAVPPRRVTAPASFTASMGRAVTAMVTEASSQLMGLASSQMRYRSVWTPAGVPTNTNTPPVASPSWIELLVDEIWLSWTVDRVAGTPARVSLARTLVTAYPPGARAALSSTASMTYGSRTVMVTVASSQFSGVAISQIR
jgi:hypothetical protein